MSIIIYTCPKCGGDLIETVIDTFPPFHVQECVKCGWKEETRDEVIRLPYQSSFNDNTPIACKGCSNHPSNGGSGICHCTLGLPKVTC